MGNRGELVEEGERTTPENDFRRPEPPELQVAGEQRWGLE